MSTIDFQLACVHCGASLSGLSVGEACAHCGQPVGDTISLAALDPVDMSVQIDLSCIGCDYNVRTLRFDAVCPECFKPVIESLRPDELRFADPKWLRTVRGGTTLLLVAVAGTIAAYFGFTLLAILWPWVFAPPRGLSVAGLALIVILCGLGVWGVFAATASEPHPRGKAGSNAPRNTARILVSLSAACVVPVFTPAGTGSGGVAFAASLMIVLFIAGGLICTLICLKRVAVGARRRGLGQLTAVLIWMIIAGGVAGGCTAVGQAIMMQQMFAQVAAAPPGAVQAAGLQPTATAPVAPGEASDGPDNAGEPVAEVTPPPPSNVAITSVTVVPGYAVTTTTISPAPPGAAVPVPMPNPIWMMLTRILTCGVSFLFLGCYVIGLIVLVKYRNLLKAAIAASPTAQRLPVGQTG